MCCDVTGVWNIIKVWSLASTVSSTITIKLRKLTYDVFIVTTVKSDEQPFSGLLVYTIFLETQKTLRYQLALIIT